VLNGSYNITIKSAKINYEFTIKRKLTIISGDSGSGKTTLWRLIERSNRQAGVKVTSNASCIALYPGSWIQQLNNISNSIFFIDESTLVDSQDFADIVKTSNNYFVIISREELKKLSYSLDEVYEIYQTGQTNRLTPLYRPVIDATIRQNFTPTKLITEDSKAGYKFFLHLCQNNRESCITAKGNSNVVTKIQSELVKTPNQTQKYLIVLDAAAFGPFTKDLITQMKRRSNDCYILAPESFEHLLLSSPMILANIKDKQSVNNPEMHGANNYSNWEQYFTDLLSNLTADTPAHYTKNKSRLPSCYTNNCHHHPSAPCQFYSRGDKQSIILGVHADNIDFSKLCPSEAPQLTHLKPSTQFTQPNPSTTKNT